MHCAAAHTVHYSAGSLCPRVRWQEALPLTRRRIWAGQHSVPPWGNRLPRAVAISAASSSMLAKHWTSSSDPRWDILAILARTSDGAPAENQKN